jgi:hypothetical protein
LGFSSSQGTSVKRHRAIFLFAKIGVGSAQERKPRADVYKFSEEKLGLAKGTIKCTVGHMNLNEKPFAFSPPN